jgi:hypothetical protein
LYHAGLAAVEGRAGADAQAGGSEAPHFLGSAEAAEWQAGLEELSDPVRVLAGPLLPADIPNSAALGAM